MENKTKTILGAFLGVLVLGVISYGCGQIIQQQTTATNYTISGKVGTVSTAGIRASSATNVTHIVAIGSNGEKYLADYSSAEGTFSIKVNKGIPYALGFYNKTGSVITLLGYLKQKEVSWESLPLMNPTGEATDLGTIEVDTSSVEATPSTVLNDLISQMNMVDQTTASYYGEIDDPMRVFTSIDVNGNGQFDFEEDKHYLFQAYVSMATGNGEISKMLNGNYNETYKPQPSGYSLVLTAKGDNQTLGALVTFTFPQAVSNNGTPTTTTTSSVEATGGGEGWTCYSKLNNNLLTSPEVAPGGTYAVTVGSTTYTLENFKAPEVVKVGSNDGIIYPVFNLVTNEAGYITTVNYKWKKLVNGTITTAEAAEVKVAIEDTSLSTAFVHPSPFISFFSDANTLIGTVYKFDRDGSSLDVSSYNIKLSEVHHIQASYNLTSRVVCKFDLY